MSDYELNSAIQKIRDNRFNFGLYKGEKANQVLITANPATAKQVTEIEKDCGDVKRLVKGICFWENDVLVFASKSTPAPAWEMLINKIFKDHKCGKYLPVTLRKLGDTESDEVSSAPGIEPPVQVGVAPPSGAAPPVAGLDPANLKAQWEELKRSLTPRVSTTVAADPSRKPEIVRWLTVGLDHERSGNYAGAIAGFQQLAAILNGTGAAAPTAPPPPPAPPPARPAPSREALLKALERLAPGIKQAVEAHPERKEEILRPIANFQALLKTNQFEGAQAALVQAATLLRTLTAEPGQPKAPAAPDSDTFWRQWRAAKTAWLNAIETVDQQIGQLQAVLRESSDPDLELIAEFGLNAVTGNFKVPLMAAMREVEAGGNERLKATASKAAKAVEAFQRHLGSDPRVRACDDNPGGVNVTLRATLEPALAALGQTLQTVP